MSKENKADDGAQVIQSPAPDAKTKILAFMCKVCPFCIVARKFPDSSYAKAMRKAEAECPACRAYDKLYGSKSD